MLLFNWKKIYETAKGNPTAIVLIVKMLTFKEIPRNKYDKIYSYVNVDFSGDSFMLHPDVLLLNAYKYDNYEVSQYFALASIRSYADYLASGEVTLDSFELSIDENLYKDNRLLSIDDDGKIHFLYEEVKQETIH